MFDVGAGHTTSPLISELGYCARADFSAAARPAETTNAKRKGSEKMMRATLTISISFCAAICDAKIPCAMPEAHILRFLVFGILFVWEEVRLACNPSRMSRVKPNAF